MRKSYLTWLLGCPFLVLLLLLLLEAVISSPMNHFFQTMSFCHNLYNITSCTIGESAYKFLFYCTFLHSHPQSISKWEKDILLVPHFENNDFTAGPCFNIFSMASNDSCLEGICLNRPSPSISMKLKIALSASAHFEETKKLTINLNKRQKPQHHEEVNHNLLK